MRGRPVGGAATGHRPLEALASDLDDVYIRLRRSLRSHTRHSVGLQPLPEAQRELLRAVRQQPGISVGGAAVALQLAGNTVSTLVRQLVGADLLERSRDEHNRRIVRLHLTPRAEERFSRYHSARTDILAEALAELDDEQRAEISRAMPALSHLLSRLETPRD